MASETYDVFISHSRLDRRHAVEIDSILRAKGLSPFFDRRNLTPGLPWVPALEQAIGAAKAAVVLIGPHGLGEHFKLASSVGSRTVTVALNYSHGVPGMRGVTKTAISFQPSAWRSEQTTRYVTRSADAHGRHADE